MNRSYHLRQKIKRQFQIFHKKYYLLEGHGFDSHQTPKALRFYALLGNYNTIICNFKY